MHEEGPAESVLIVRPNRAPTRVRVRVPEDCNVTQYDIGANGADLPLTEVYVQGEPDTTELSRAQEMALAVLQGDEEAALVLADYVLENYARAAR